VGSHGGTPRSFTGIDKQNVHELSCCKGSASFVKNQAKSINICCGRTQTVDLRQE
jgi:hypothetical protein